MAQKKITPKEQNAIISLNEMLPFKTTTHINFDGSINTGIAAEKVEFDPSTGVGTADGEVKKKFDKLDERTISGTNWDNIDIKKVLGN